MIRTIASTARIATKIIKDGSNSGRDKYCQKLEDKLYNRLKKYKRTQFDYIGKNVHEILPTKLIQVEKLPETFENCNGVVSLAQEVEKTVPADIVGYIVGYIVGFNKDGKKKQFGGVKMEVLMHEMHHLFNYLTHPKVPNRIYKVSKISSKINFEKFFVENFQSTMPPKKCKEATKKLLKREEKHKIDILQYFRYKLIDEIGAYRSGEHYSNLYSSKSKECFQSNIDAMQLETKLNDVTAILKKTLKTEREGVNQKRGKSIISKGRYFISHLSDLLKINHKN